MWRSVDDAATWTKVQDGSTDDVGYLRHGAVPRQSGLYKLSTPGVAGMGGASESPSINVEVNAKVTLTTSRSTVTLPSARGWSTRGGIATRTVTFRVVGPGRHGR